MKAASKAAKRRYRGLRRQGPQLGEWGAGNRHRRGRKLTADGDGEEFGPRQPLRGPALRPLTLRSDAVCRTINSVEPDVRWPRARLFDPDHAAAPSAADRPRRIRGQRRQPGGTIGTQPRIFEVAEAATPKMIIDDGGRMPRACPSRHSGRQNRPC